jgi:hypothetical protein
MFLFNFSKIEHTNGAGDVDDAAANLLGVLASKGTVESVVLVGTKSVY